jgi:hypothetical protein
MDSLKTETTTMTTSSSYPSLNKSQTSSLSRSPSTSPGPTRHKKTRRGGKKKPQLTTQPDDSELEALKEKLAETKLALERSQQLVKAQSMRLLKLSRELGKCCFAKCCFTVLLLI